MFQFKYFILFVAFGFGSGYANPDITGDEPNPMSFLFLPMSIIGAVLIIWSFFTFGIFWGIVSALEFGLGYVIGRTVNA